jgi:hypothetical protein
MIRKIAFINKIRELGYRHKSQQARTHMYRKDGGTHCIFVRDKDFLSEDFVKGALGQAGLSVAEIRAFIAAARAEATASFNIESRAKK